MRLLLAAFLALTLTLHADDEQLRHELERTFSDWRAAIAAHDLAGWQRTTATFRQVMTRNVIVSQNHPYPQALFDFPLHAPEISTLRFMRAAAKGPTANLIYFGKVDLGIPDSDIPENLLVLEFINEGGKWKFDTLRLINLAESPEVRAALKNGVTAGILDEAELQPEGVAPEIPKLCPKPDYIGGLQVTALGYAFTARVNGFALPTVADRSEQHLIVGGLRDGENSLSMEIKPTPVAEGSARHLEINAVIITNDPKKPFIRVFNWTPQSNIPAVSEQKIYVNRITLRGG